MDRCDGEDKVIIIIAIILLITGLVLGLTDTGPLLGLARDYIPDNEGEPCSESIANCPSSAWCEGGGNTACISAGICERGNCVNLEPNCGLCVAGRCGAECSRDSDCNSNQLVCNANCECVGEV
jgi:hypothetical protein